MSTTKERRITITAPAKQRREVRKLLHDIICVRSRPRLSVVEHDHTQCPNHHILIDLARKKLIKIHPPEVKDQVPPELQSLRDRRRQLFISRLTPKQLEEAIYHNQGLKPGPGVPFRITAEEAIAEILRRIGPAGEQALEDERRYFETYNVVQYDSSKHFGRDKREPSLATIASDCSAAIITFIEVGQYIHYRRWEHERGYHHMRFVVILVVRDATTGERHLIRIPPRFGRYKSETYYRLRKEGPDVLIQAALAWTFGLEPDEYRPTIET